jgi:hypothetical protein
MRDAERDHFIDQLAKALLMTLGAIEEQEDEDESFPTNATHEERA